MEFVLNINNTLGNLNIKRTVHNKIMFNLYFTDFDMVFVPKTHAKIYFLLSF